MSAACSCCRPPKSSPPPRLPLSARALGALAVDRLTKQGPQAAARLLEEILDEIEAAVAECDARRLREAVLAGRVLCDGLRQMDRGDSDGRDEPAAEAAD